MKKVTIITPPEYEGYLLESLGKSQVVHLVDASGPDFDELKDASGEGPDYKLLYQKVNERYSEILGMGDFTVERKTPSVEELRVFTLNPEAKVDAILDDAISLIDKIKEKQENQHLENNKIVTELQTKLDSENETFEKEKEALVGKLADRVLLSARLESLQALAPEELKSCFAVGVVKKDLVSKVEEYLRRYESTYYRTASISAEESFIFVFGSDENRKWVEALFLVFEIKDIFDVLDARDILLVLDPKKRSEAIEKYQAELRKQGEKTDASGVTEEERKIREKVTELERNHNQAVNDLRNLYDGKIRANDEAYRKEIADFKNEQGDMIGIIDYYVGMLGMFRRKNVRVLRGKVISVIQGYTADYDLPNLENAISDAEKVIGEKLFVEITELDETDKNAPTPEMDFPDILQPAWILTRLRGWPSAQEINPGWISLFIFCLQFGLMFGDIGQGAIFLGLGLYLSKKFDKGMMSYLGTLFLPMGVSAIIFGLMYDSIFLVEHAISDVLHGAHISLPFHYPIMPNPIHETTKLMVLIFGFAALEVVFGLVLGVLNQIRMGNPIGALGQHGLGMILYVIGFYLTAMNFINTGMSDFMGSLGYWAFKLVLAGLALSFAEPIIHSVKHGHGVGMEAIGEGIGGLLMTFVEGLANLFSFLRIAAFALAHASLGIAAVALSDSLKIPGIGLVIMNVIALSFEFVSSSVQSIRLLYYEFMGKFFQGEGIRYRPFRLRSPKPIKK